MSSPPSWIEEIPETVEIKDCQETEEEEKSLTEREKSILRELERHKASLREIERRKEAMSIKNEMPLGSFTELKSKFGYQFAVVNKAHRRLNPPCDHPAFRILGLFRNEGELSNWVDELRETNMMFFDERSGEMKCKMGDLHKLPLLQYMLIPKNRDRERDEEYTKNKISDIKKINIEHLKQSQKEFEDNMQSRVQGKMGLSLDKKREKAREKRKNAPREKALRTKSRKEQEERQEAMKEVSRVPRLMELRAQKFAIIVVLMDVTQNTLAAKDDPEPAIMIIDAFDTCEEAEEYMETLKNHVFCMSMHVVDMYEWLYPEDIRLDDIRERYRNPEEDKVMQEKKTQKQKLLDYEYKQRNEGFEVPAIEVTEQSNAPEGFNPLKSQPEFSYEESSEKVDREEIRREEELRLKYYKQMCKEEGFNFLLDENPKEEESTIMSELEQLDSEERKAYTKKNQDKKGKGKVT